MSASTSTSTPPIRIATVCKHCRARKVKCVKSEGDDAGRCVGCVKADLSCEYDVLKRRPGRVNMFAMRMREQQAATRSLEDAGDQTANGTVNPTQIPFSPSLGGGDAISRAFGGDDPVISGSINDAAWWEELGLMDSTADMTGRFVVDALSAMPQESPDDHSHAPSLTSETKVGRKKEAPQIEDSLTWAQASRLVSLFLQHLYPLVPLVHRPSFAHDLINRRDLHDEDFRALLFSIIAFVICQSAVSLLIQDGFSVDDLKRIQRRCHLSSKTLQRSYYRPAELIHVTTIMFDCFYLMSTGLVQATATRIGQAVQLAYSMGLNSDSATLALSLDPVEVQLRRRLFWQIYVADKSRALNGNTILIHDFNNTCSLPEEVDDEFVTSQGIFAQPRSKTSVMCGFVATCRIFRLMGRAHLLQLLARSPPHPSIRGDPQCADDLETELDNLMSNLSLGLQDPLLVYEQPLRNILQTQKANVLITATIARFAIFDLAALYAYSPERLSKKRASHAGDILQLLRAMPLDALASNGRAILYKIIYIACVLCVQQPYEETTQSLARDWCTLFTDVSFVQAPGPDPQSTVQSRLNSPSAS